MSICLVWCGLFAFFVSMILILLSLKSSISRTISSFNSLIKYWIYTVFLAAYPSIIYSASVVDVNTILCFLLFHETSALLMKKQYAITDVCFSGSLIKLLSVYLMRLYRSGSIGAIPSSLWLYTNHSCLIFFKYQTTFFATHRWPFLGLELYLLSCPTTKAMFGLVPHARYINLPMRH